MWIEISQSVVRLFPAVWWQRKRDHRMAHTEYYAALGVPTDASADDIKRAYRKMARKYHPDVNTDPEADAKFKAAGMAYDVLRDPEKRAAYDRFGADWDQPRAQPEPERGWQRQSAFDEQDFDAEMFREFFGQQFGARGRMPRDQHARIEITLEEAMQGAQKTLTLQTPETDRAGRIALKTRTVDLKVPKAVLPGQTLRLKGQGTDGGDLFIEVAFRPHPVFEIAGHDLYVTLPITPWEAALGGKVKMPTPTGPVDLNIPENARTGQKLRLRERGLPAAQKGDLYAVLQIVNPPKVNKAAQDLYRDLARAQPFNPRSKLGV